MPAQARFGLLESVSRCWLAAWRWRHFSWLCVPAWFACGFGSAGSGGPILGRTGAGGASAEGGAAGMAPSQTNSGGSTLTSSDGAGNASGQGYIQEPVCGDGKLGRTEECDDANVVDGDGCDSHCFMELSMAACGDGRVEGDEACDDANLQPGDGCDASCRIERCGNERVDAGEECDPPVTGECTSSCLFLSPNCGDGVLQEHEFEECDDGNDDPSDGCHLCREQCGNGRVDRTLGEQCEPRHSSAGSCSDDCQYLPVCGDGELQTEAGEQCDPDNGVTCVACQLVDPPPPDCVEGAGGEGGACPAPPACVPSSGGLAELVQNGRFDTGISPWAPHQALVSLAAVSAGVPDPNALEVAFGAGPVRALSGAFQCIPIEAGAAYEFEAEYFIAANAPVGVETDVTILLYAGPRCDGAWVPPPGRGPVGRVRNTWTPYHYPVDTSPLLALGNLSEARLLVRVNVIRPADVAGSRVLWDNIMLSDPASSCGNCVVDEGETCDDGNQTVGDGCDRSCNLEICGNGVVQPPEQCDDGNAVFGADGDACTASCRNPSACDSCAAAACSAQLGACAGLQGHAENGPTAGVARSTLCDRLRICVHESACDRVPRNSEGVAGSFLENCYCGSAGTHCFDTGGSANGSCKAEIEAALETKDPIEVFARFGGFDINYPVTAALDELLACEQGACASECVRAPACGDGWVQDRNFDFTFTIGREEVSCRDELTHTGRGCSFEECDDGNLSQGDGCDEYCFMETCGNHVVQAGEECDDGNLEAGDGCDAECQAEFVCGDSIVQEPFEVCDPPDSGKVCSLAEYEASPAQCGCDQSCSHLVCGDGIVQRPAEECDPPNGISCGDDCQLLDQGPCEDCLNDDVDIGPFNQEFCNVDPDCFTIKACTVESGCFRLDAGRAPAECYCGIDADLLACEEDQNFVPSGPCADEILAGAGSDDPTHADVLNRFYDSGYSVGVAMLILSTAATSQVCIDECQITGP